MVATDEYRKRKQYRYPALGGLYLKDIQVEYTECTDWQGVRSLTISLEDVQFSSHPMDAIYIGKPALQAFLEELGFMEVGDGFNDPVRYYPGRPQVTIHETPVIRDYDGWKGDM